MANAAIRTMPSANLLGFAIMRNEPCMVHVYRRTLTDNKALLGSRAMAVQLADRWL